MVEVSKNFVFFSMLLFSVVVSVSSSSWIVCWMMMELSSFFFFPVLFSSWSTLSSMTGLKYFLFQCVGSSLFLFSVLSEGSSGEMVSWSVGDSSMSLICCLSMVIKLGIFPFHGVMFHIGENLPWMNMFILSSIQEIIPLVIISKFGGNTTFFIFILLINMIVMMVFSIGNFSVHWMVMISSLFNISWLSIASLLSKGSLLFFLAVYFLVLSFMICMFKNLRLSGSLSSCMNKFSSKEEKVVVSVVMIMIMGLPPFGSFIAKAYLVEEMVKMNLIWLSLAMLLVSSVFTFLYLKVITFVNMGGGGVKKFSLVMYSSLLLLVIVPSLLWIL